MIVCGLPMAAFAAEPDDLTATVEMDSSTAQASDAVVPYANPVVTGSIPALETRTFTVRLNSYIGLSKTFRVTAQSPSTNQGGLDYMLNSSDSSDEAKQETMAMLKYTYEQILASRAEQVVSQSNNSHLSAFGEILSNHAFKREENNNIEKNKNFRVV